MNIHTAPNPSGEIRDQLRLAPSMGLTFANSSLTNTTSTTATYKDIDAGGAGKFYRVVSP
jgi:hypothetical protein